MAEWVQNSATVEVRLCHGVITGLNPDIAMSQPCVAIKESLTGPAHPSTFDYSDSNYFVIATHFGTCAGSCVEGSTYCTSRVRVL